MNDQGRLILLGVNGEIHESRIVKDFEKEQVDRLLQQKEDITAENRRIAVGQENILHNLHADRRSVIKKSSVSKKEAEVLIENGFKHANEFCVYEKKTLSVLVKPKSNHAITHAFLVCCLPLLLILSYL
jgi:hypothetical protein